MAKENEIKIKHHYVSREHLRNWSSDRKNIWYTTKYNKTARDGIAGLAMEKFFYSISEINSEDEEYIKEILKPNFSETVEKKLTPYIDTLILLSKEMTSEKNPNRNKMLKNNILENIYTEHENKIKIIQRDICNERKIKSEDIKYTLLIFICIQKSKTKPFKTNVTKKINENNHFINPEKMKYLLEKNWWIISHISAYIIASNLFNSGYDLYILENNNEKNSLITSDSAVFVIDNTSNYFKTLIKKTSYYFPLSPKIALVASNDEYYKNKSHELSSDQVDHYNELVASSQHNHLFAISETMIKKAQALKKRHTSDTPSI